MAGPDTSNINALLARGVGPSLLEGAHAGYFGFSGRAGLEQAQQQRLVAGDQNIPAAMAGDQNALGQVAARNPQAAAAITMAQSRAAESARKAHLDAVEWSGRAADTILKTAPADRPAAWQQLYKEGMALGHDMSQTPPQWTPDLEAQMRTIRNMAPDYVKAQRQIELKKTAPGKAAGVGGGGSGEVWGDGKQSSLPSTGPVVADATPVPGSATGSATATLASQASPVTPNVQPAPAFVPPDANRNVMPPDIVPPQDDPEVINPGTPPMSAVQQASAGPPQGFQAMGHRDPQGNLVPALIDGKPVYRNPQTGEMKLGDALPPPSGPVPDQSSGGTNAQGPGGALPPGIQMAKLGDRSAPKMVEDYPGERGGVSGTRPGEKGRPEIIKGPGGGTLFRMQDGTYEEWNPKAKPTNRFEDIHQDPNNPNSPLIGQRDTTSNQFHPITMKQSPIPGMPSDLADVHGDAFKQSDYWKNLNPLIKDNIEGMLTGMPISNLSKRAGQGGLGMAFNDMVGLAHHVDPSFTGNEGEMGKRFALSLEGNSQNAQNKIAANVAPIHAADLVKLTDEQQQNNPRAAQEVINRLKSQFGDTAIPDMTAARNISAIEFLRAAVGPAHMNQTLEKEFLDSIPTNATASQMRSIVKTYVDKVAERASVLQDTADGYHLNTKIISPRAKEAMDFLRASPGSPATGNYPGVPAQQPSWLESIFGTNKPAAPQGNAAAPTITEGMTATNPQTKQKVIFKGGQWVPVQ